MAKYLDYNGLQEYDKKIKEVINKKPGGVAVTPSGATASATSGTFTTDEWKTLQENNENYILFNNEIYRLADKGHTTGIWSYTHSGWSNDDSMDKSINVTISTRAWTLVTAKAKLDKVSTTTSNNQIYAKLANGTQSMVNYSSQLVNDALVSRASDGTIAISAGTKDTDGVNKKQMEEAIASAITTTLNTAV